MSEQPEQPEHSPEGHQRPGAKPRVAVVFGGRSAEHGVSCVTAGSVLAAIDRDRYDVVPIGIAADGRWVLEADDSARLEITDGKLPEVDEKGAPVVLSSRDLVVTDPGDVPRQIGEVDIVFPLLHGPFGEDGTIQGLLEMAGVRYVGAGVLSSAVGMDKHYMKLVFQAAGLPVTPYVVITPREWRRDPAVCRESAAGLGFPLFVKPARAGSSFGISKVRNHSELDDAVAEAQRHDPKVLVEAFAAGAREIECGVLQGRGDDPPQASVVAEIKITGEHEFYDFAAKYLPEEATELDVPADVADEATERIRDLAVRAFEAIGAEGLARVDFFVLPDGSVVINEINTMPGFTPTSMFPRMWAASGLDYRALVDRLLTLARQRPLGLR
ncbi:MAG TPA: D-alanine--D-alanine ligase family protein [Nocardioidaceae bacterium]|nr:D-alanine--D-alanine ligase family protein [Nocardioidaceae bacterium]